MVDDGVPRHLLQQPVQRLDRALGNPRLGQDRRHGQAHWALPVDHRVVAIRLQHRQRRLGVAELIAKEVFLRFQPGCLPVDDLFPQRDHRLARRHDEYHLLPQLFVQGREVLIHRPQIVGLLRLQHLLRRRIVVHLGRLRHRLRFAGLALVAGVHDARIVDVERRPRFHHGHADVGIVREAQLRVVLDARVRQVARRQDEHVQLPRGQHLLGSVGGVVVVPVLDGF